MYWIDNSKRKKEQKKKKGVGSLQLEGIIENLFESWKIREDDKH